MSIPYQRAMSLGGNCVGHPVESSIKPVLHNNASSTQTNQWQFPPGIYTPRQFIAQLAAIPESILVQLGPDDASATPSEMTQQAKKVGDTLLQYALEHNYTVSGIAELKVYSPCEGHKWLPPVGQLLRSSRSSPTLMMLYNVWLHQITCLRDSLLSFENFKEVQLDLSDPSHHGTRRMESIRESFLRNIQAQTHTDADILEVAKVLTAPNLPEGGYGFQLSQGTVLPAVLFTQSATRLLRYFTAHVQETGEEDRCVLFECPSFNLQRNL
ncbi:hypothetical protein N7490_003534 [Penicillium lividum]|nr:hypothetical protein N7490_003534 [Penicillium lividum]